MIVTAARSQGKPGASRQSVRWRIDSPRAWVRTGTGTGGEMSRRPSRRGQGFQRRLVECQWGIRGRPSRALVARSRWSGLMSR